MGVLDIRMRSERLGNLGQIVTPNLRTGEAETWGAAGRAVGGLGEAAAKVAGAIGAMRDKEDRRQVDNANAEIQRRFNLYMMGNGTAENVGAMNAKFQNGADWMSENGRSYDDIARQVKRDMKLSDRQFEMTMQSLNGYRLNWDSRQMTHAGNEYRRSQVEGATSRLALAADDIVNGSTPAGWDSYRNAVREVMDVTGVRTPEGEEAFRRKSGQELFKRLCASRIGAEAAKFETSTDPAEVAKHWDGVIAEARAGRGMPVEELKEFAGGLGAPERTPDGRRREASGLWKSYVQDLERAKARAVNVASNNRTMAVNSLMDEFNADVVSIRQQPENMQGDLYRAWGEKFRDLSPSTYASMNARAQNADDLAKQKELKSMENAYRIAEAEIRAAPHWERGELYREQAKRFKGVDDAMFASITAKAIEADEISHSADMDEDTKARLADEKAKVAEIQSMQKAAEQAHANDVATTEFEALEFASRPEDRTKLADWYERRKLLDAKLTAMKLNGQITPEKYAKIASLLDTSYDSDTNRGVGKFLERFGVDRNVYRTESQAISFLRGASNVSMRTPNGRTVDIPADEIIEYQSRFVSLLNERRQYAKDSDVDRLVHDCIDEIMKQYVDENAQRILGRLDDTMRRRYVGDSMAVRGYRSMRANGGRISDEQASTLAASLYAKPVDVVEEDERGNTITE